MNKIHHSHHIGSHFCCFLLLIWLFWAVLYLVFLGLIDLPFFFWRLMQILSDLLHLSVCVNKSCFNRFPIFRTKWNRRRRKCKFLWDLMRHSLLAFADWWWNRRHDHAITSVGAFWSLNLLVGGFDLGWCGWKNEILSVQNANLMG